MGSHNLVYKDVHQVTTIGDEASVDEAPELREYRSMFSPLS